jgi:hypothetical protein
MISGPCDGHVKHVTAEVWNRIPITNCFINIPLMRS